MVQWQCAIMVNGATWPYLEVEKRRYRFRFLPFFGFLQEIASPTSSR